MFLQYATKIKNIETLYTNPTVGSLKAVFYLNILIDKVNLVILELGNLLLVVIFSGYSHAKIHANPSTDNTSTQFSLT